MTIETFMNPTALVIIPILSLLFSNQLLGQEIPTGIYTAEKSWEAIIASGDKSAFQELLADEFTWTYINGLSIEKAEAINRLRPFNVSEDSIAIKTYGNTAVVSGTASFMMQGRSIKERFVRIWARNKDGKWQLVLFQATEIQ